MVKGLYTAYTGMINQQKRMDVLTNNLANSATTGYKKEGATSVAFDEVLAVKIKDGSEGYVNRGIGNMSMGVKIGESYIDYTQGGFRVTDGEFDLAVEGDGFFQIAYTNKAGETTTKYTRDGAFILTKEGQLVTKDGDPVLSENGALLNKIDTSAEVRIDTTGRIYADDKYVDTVGLVDFEDYNYLKQFGENMYETVEGATMTDAENGRVQQGCLETSNVQVVSEMVEMINVTRAYETNQKVIQTIDTMLDKSVNQVGKV